ncbi:MAG: gliding motility-associated ABC transporter substrate-binding protein GldG [Bacteroidales bacterium]|nr:gliding motility-associated ABC transporter substrate-binding protein GldG [Bacteroidales bacterium]
MSNKKLLWVVAVVVLLNLLTYFWHFRIDLTKEGRYTLSDVTKSYADSVTQPVVVTMYLDGELNSGFRRLRRQVVETLTEISYEIDKTDFRVVTVNPGDLSKEVGVKLQRELSEAGLAAIPVFETKEDGQKTRSIVYPFAKISTEGKHVWVNLLDNVPGLSGEENLNRSMETIEYKVTEALMRLTRTAVPKVAFLEGHGELDEYDVVSATEQLAEHFYVDRGAIGDDPTVLSPYKVVIIAKPSAQFSEKDKFVLDQYLMRGGRLLWLVDAVNMTTDTLRNMPHTIGLLADHNLSDQLFVYGVRLKPAIVEDLNCGMIAVSVPSNDGRTQLLPMPWVYSPLLSTNMTHTVTRNVSLVRADFCSSVDTVGEDLGLIRTPLLRTSSHSKLTAAPVMASLSTIHQQPDPNAYGLSHLTVAIAEEGSFKSAFVHRKAPKGLKTEQKVIEKSVPTKMIVVADGDIIRNGVRFKHTANPSIVPLGYDELSRQTYGNSDFIVNAVQYLADDGGLMELRNRTFDLQLLDRQMISAGTVSYKVVTIAVPLLIITIVGFAIYIMRRRRYARRVGE